MPNKPFHQLGHQELRRNNGQNMTLKVLECASQKNVKYFARPQCRCCRFYQVSKVLVSALTDGIISCKMFNFEIYIESYARTLGQYFHSQQSQHKDCHCWMNLENNGVGIFCFLKSIAFWSCQLQWNLPGRNEILLS